MISIWRTRDVSRITGLSKVWSSVPKTMERDCEGRVREPLLGGCRIENWSTMSPWRLRGDLVSRLLEKARHRLDQENPCQIDVSKIAGLLKGEKDYYERQFATIANFEEVDSLITSSKNDEDHEDQENIEQTKSVFAMKISNYSNIFLLVLKVYATIRSGSVAIAASTLDSLLDLIAGGVLWFTHLSMQNINIYKYPIGNVLRC